MCFFTGSPRSPVSPGIPSIPGLPCKKNWLLSKLFCWIVKISPMGWIYVICRLGGPYREKLWPRPNRDFDFNRFLDSGIRSSRLLADKLDSLLILKSKQIRKFFPHLHFTNLLTILDDRPDLVSLFCPESPIIRERKLAHTLFSPKNFHF